MAATFVDRITHSRASGVLLRRAPVPLALARPVLRHDNAVETRRDGWGRLAATTEEARYAAVRELCREHAPQGRLLDVGCSRGLLQPGADYSHYTGIDADHVGLQHAQTRSDERTVFLHADADAYEPASPLDAIVFNEMLYYLPRPVHTVRRLADHLAPGGVLVVSMFDAWATRRISRQLGALFPVARSRQVPGPSSAVWTVTVHRPATSAGT